MNRYRGSATLITGDGTQYAAEVALWVEGEPDGLRQWLGTASIPNFDLTQLGAIVLRLPNGREGNALLVTATSDSDQVELRGVGKPPFAED
jgi:hypothetical protein